MIGYDAICYDMIGYDMERINTMLDKDILLILITPPIKTKYRKETNCDLLPPALVLK